MSRPTTGDEIREAYLRFYEERDHLRHRAASLIPAGDPTLLLTNSGMAQFKAFFSGEATPPHPRITTAQKCFRATDIDEVGDATHLTMFEMLGNFSFGDYFKQEACEWALDLMTRVLEFPLDRLYVTVHDTDDECERIWLSLGVPKERISRFGDKENWWGPAGEEGPCGPCSELHYYRGDLAAVPAPDHPSRAQWGPNLHADFAELYNLVFTQFYHHLDGTRTELPSKNIDTGMGLERTAAAIQGVASVYETDILRPLLEQAEELSGLAWGAGRDTDRALGVVVEHCRSAAFLIGDGVVPENTGRGYVLRRIIRRCVRFARQLHLEGPFMGELAQVAIDCMGHVYPELLEQAPFILRVLDLEERQFAATVDQGSTLLVAFIRERPATTAGIEALRQTPSPWDAPTLEEGMAATQKLLHSSFGTASDTGDLLLRVIRTELGDPPRYTPLTLRETQDAMARVWDDIRCFDWEGSISGYEAFYLSDTYGFPFEVTAEIAAEHGMKVDREGFEREMDRQRQRARAAARFGGDTAAPRVFRQMGVRETPFVGYDTLEAESVVAGLLKDGAVVGEANEGDAAGIVLHSTPFYAESGGQVGDRGVIRGDDFTFEVEDTQRPVEGVIVHHGRVKQGRVAVGDRVSARVDGDRRESVRRSHTATHLLHAALRETLGRHVRQHGSLVAPDRLRFDFTHVSPLTREDILAVQRRVNDMVRRNLAVRGSHATYREAVEAGALAFFGDKYGDTVRTLQIGDGEPFSYELCGGTHCRTTGEIGAMFIVSESSVGGGLRRIEAVTGQSAEELASERFGVLDRLSSKLQTPHAELERRTDALLAELEAARRRLAELERQKLLGGVQTARPFTEAQVLDRLEALLHDRALEDAAISVARDAPVGEAGRLRADLAAQVRDVTILFEVKSGATVDQLREVGDHYRSATKAGVVALAIANEERPALIVMLTPDLVQKGLRAGDMARAAGQAMGGGGGGRPDVGQAGGRDAAKLADALAKIADILAGHGSEL